MGARRALQKGGSSVPGDGWHGSENEAIYGLGHGERFWKSQRKRQTREVPQKRASGETSAIIMSEERCETTGFHHWS